MSVLSRLYSLLSYDVAVCDKNRTTTRGITLWRVFVTSLTTSVPTMRFLSEIMFILKAIISDFKGSNEYRILHS